MDLIQVHKYGEVIAHLDMDDGIIAVEIPPATLKICNIMERAIKTTNNPMCTKGLKECTDEITLENVRFTLACNYSSIHTGNVVLENVFINTKSLEEAHAKALKERDTPIDTTLAPYGYCASFDPISKKYGGTFKCDLCSLYGVCVGGNYD